MERRDRVSATTSESRLGLDLTHTCCIWEHTTASFQAWDVWTGHREHPSSFLPLCQSCARRVLGSEEDPFVPTSMRHVAFFKHLNLQKSSFFVCVPILATAAGSTTHWFSMQRGVPLCRSKPRFIRAYPQRCTVTHRPAGALQGVAMGDDVARARVRLLRHDVRRPKNRKLACLLQPSSLPSPTSFLPSFLHLLTGGT